MKTKEWIAEYDVGEYISNQIEFFKNDKQEFLVSILWDEEREPEGVSDKEIEDYFYSYDYIGDDCFEDLINDLDEEFTQHIGKQVRVEGREIGWRNLSGYKEFKLRNATEIFTEIVPECDLTYKIEKLKEKEPKE